MDVTERFHRLKAATRLLCPAPLKPSASSNLSGYILIFSASDGNQRALTRHASADDFGNTWQTGMRSIKAAMKQEKITGKHLRVDWVESNVRTTWEGLQRLVSSVKRTYFRFGFALDEKCVRLLTEMECHANAVYYGDSSMGEGRFNEKNFAVYAGRRFNGNASLPSSPEDPVWVVGTAGVYMGPEDDDPLPVPGLLPKNFGLVSRGLYAGHREIPRLTPELLRQVVGSAGRWLAEQILPDGKFIYGRFPCFDRPIAAYNSLRHASSLYSLLDIIPFTGDASLLEPVSRSLAFLTENFIREYRPAPGKKAAFLVESDAGEIKLGANGVALLAFAAYRELTGETQYDELMSLLAEGIAFMQNPDTGAFTHVLHSDTLAVKDPFRTIYYDGEAVFGLLRLYKQAPNPRLLSLAQKAFAHFLDSRPHQEAHDHWLSYAANEISALVDDDRYIAFGIANCMPHLDFILRRETAYPTLLELMTAAQKMFLRLKASGSSALDTVDMDKFKRALHYRAHYLLNGYFWPETTMFFKYPDRVTRAFFIRHQAFRARIDDSQHFLSGLAAYGSMLADGDPFWAAPEDARALGSRFAGK